MTKTKKASSKEIQSAVEKLPTDLKELLQTELKGEFVNLRPLDSKELL